MAHHDHHPVDIDPQALRQARDLWQHFTKYTTWGVAVIVVLLGLMYFTLV